MKNHFARLLLLLLMGLTAQAQAESNDEQALMKTVRGFYDWVLKDGKQVGKLQPAIKNIPGGHQFRLDTHSLPAFTEKFIASGYFAPVFAGAVERYYAKYTQQFKTYTKAEFDQIAKDGRGPLMDTEDMDIFFCAQEYEYKKAFVAKMKPKAVKVDGDTASMKVVSSMEWETEFKFVKIKQQWLIAGYCVFQ